ncbi:methionine gamma-lyase [Marinicauda pacifica]|jgi:cystathionine gamma-synthase/methionine-gamma-lyase|uniref:Cystathionine gamma-synthase family protein n=1 Tax=Marinicauda pacifica TaxID=1133559 RepID=A0A4S2HEF3_9PROT|nr:MULTISPECIES: cystathionine gamma-synthase family protein [Marinicauda]TGY94253.1 cystathionine gamma-synthase family protein [Marinicauda pacifica]GGE34293.1 methionine gamma-lyase [Marinicauda pacifica]
MSKPDTPYRKRALGNRPLSPETLAMSYGYDAKLSEGSIKPPIFQTSTFVFSSAEEGASFFRVMGGRAEEGDPATPGLMYSRFNNPNVEVIEDRLTVFEDADEACVFSSGMGAISTVLMAFANAGDVILQSTPLYGGTETLIRNVLPNYGVKSHDFVAGAPEAEIRQSLENAMKDGTVKAIYTETPTNPTNEVVDLELMKTLADELGERQGYRPPVIVDNTVLGPIGQKPLSCGADIIVYSLTKYVGGHSDLIAGAALGSSEYMKPVRKLRSAIGTNLDANTCWMLARSLETVTLRMKAAFENARKVAEFLNDHPKVERVRYLGFLEEGSRDHKVHTRQAGDYHGSTFSFDVAGGQKGAFAMLNALQVVKLAVSLGGTETLICHPGSTTHAGVDPELRKRLGFTEGMVRVSIGIEDPEDLIADFDQALSKI